MDRRSALLCMALTPFVTEARAGEAAIDPWRARVLVGPDGKSTSLIEHARSGRLVVVTMKGHWCGVCLGQLARFSALRARLEKLNARVVGLNADPHRANAEAAKLVGIPLPILSDSRHPVLEALGLWLAEAEQPMPGIVVFDECGRERGRLVGRSPGQRDENAVIALLQKIAATPPKCQAQPNA
ncbi:MAG TPA: redoxin domain-containing protein [Polyangiaceae bacterium]|nr:redoxin domain-containing protein [Polyangiaceae bacterium]